MTRVFHPAPEGEFVHLGDGVHAEVQAGAAGYQITTGELIEL